MFDNYFFFHGRLTDCDPFDLSSFFLICVLQGELVTASKAIIEKEYQPKVIVSKQGPNPFTKLTDQDMDDYRREVEQKQKGSEGKEELASVM